MGVRRQIVFLVVLVASVAAINKQDLLKLGEETKIAEECRPFGVRLHWGRNVYDSRSSQKLNVRFNTNKECRNVGLLLNSAFLINCPTKDVSEFVMADGTTMTSFIHTCSLSSQIRYGEAFTYNLIDQGSQNTYFNEDITLTIQDPHDVERPVKFVHFSDWAKITLKTQEREDIAKTIRKMQKTQNLDGIIINGDMAYDLDTDLQHHLKFMDLLQSIAMNTPILVNRGNHEYDSAGAIFCEYFQTYDLCQNNATALGIGAAYLNLFDPQANLIPRKFRLYNREERLSSLTYLIKYLEKTGIRIPIAMSHYPLACSYPTSEHCVPNQAYNEFLPLYVNLQTYYQTLLDYKVPLMLAGHIHAYQRTHKLLRGYKYVPIEEKRQIQYKEGDEFMVQVIEGVAGSDGDLYGEEKVAQGEEIDNMPFVAVSQHNTIGFGILTVSPKNINYQHLSFSNKSAPYLFDSFTINLSTSVHPENIENEL